MPKLIYAAFCILMCVCMLLCLNYCGPKDTVHNTGFYTPYYIAESNVVRADQLSPMQFDRVYHVETDIYGRQYFRYITYSSFMGCKIEIHLISQQAEADRAYYYPDVCYMTKLESDAPFTEEQQALLKSHNDWNQPFSLEKCSIVEGTQKPLVYEDTFRETLRKYLKLDNSYSILCNSMEWITENRQYYSASVISDKGDKSHYILVYEKSSTDTIVACEEIDFSGDYQDVIREFRKSFESNNQENG